MFFFCFFFNVNKCLVNCNFKWYNIFSRSFQFSDKCVLYYFSFSGDHFISYQSIRNEPTNLSECIRHQIVPSAHWRNSLAASVDHHVTGNEPKVLNCQHLDILWLKNVFTWVIGTSSGWTKMWTIALMRLMGIY